MEVQQLPTSSAQGIGTRAGYDLSSDAFFGGPAYSCHRPATRKVRPGILAQHADLDALRRQGGRPREPGSTYEFF
jgi:hypothetical protein